MHVFRSLQNAVLTYDLQRKTVFTVWKYNVEEKFLKPLRHILTQLLLNGENLKALSEIQKHRKFDFPYYFYLTFAKCMIDK